MRTKLLGLKRGLFWLAVALATGASSGNAAIIVSINGMDRICRKKSRPIPGATRTLTSSRVNTAMSRTLFLTAPMDSRAVRI